MRLILIRQIIKFLNFQMLHTSSATSTYVCRSPGTLVIKLTLYEEYIKLGFTASKMYSAHNEMQRHARFSSFWSDRHFCSQIHPRLFYGSTLQTFNSIAYLHYMCTTTCTYSAYRFWHIPQYTEFFASICFRAIMTKLDFETMLQ